MSTTAVGISNISNTLQKVIMPYIQDNFPKETILTDQVKRNTNVKFMNDTFYAPVRSSRHGGIHALASDKSKLNTGQSNTDQASVNVKEIVGTFDISDLAIKASRSDRGAVENSLTFQARTLSSDYAREINRMAMGDGFGIVGMVNGSASGSSVVLTYPDTNLDDTRGLDRYGSVNGDIAVDEWIQPGQILGVGTAAAGTAKVSSVTNGTIVFTGTVASNQYDSVYILDGDGGGAGTAEIQGAGLALGATSGSYANIPRTTYGWSPQRDTTAEDLTMSAITGQYLAGRKFAKTKDRYAIFMNVSLYEKYGNLLTAMRRTVNTTELLGGWTGLEFSAGAGKVGVFLDYQVPDGEVLVLNLDTWTICQVSDMDWLEDPNGSAMLRRTDYTTYQAVMVWYTNWLCVAPAANAKLAQKTN